MPMSVQESLAEAWVGRGLLQGWRPWGQQYTMGPFEGGHHYLPNLHHSSVSAQATGREHNPTNQQNIGLKIYWTWPRPSEQEPIFPSVGLSHQKASISLILIHQRADRMKTTITENYRGLDNWNDSLGFRDLWMYSASISCSLVSDSLGPPGL